MTSIANDGLTPSERTASEWEMTVLELLIFLCVYRAKRPARLADLCATLAEWFERPVLPEVASTAVARMVQYRWLIVDGDRLRPAAEGRETARPLMNGVIRMLDQGTKLIDVVLMMSVLRLTMDELSGSHADA